MNTWHTTNTKLWLFCSAIVYFLFMAIPLEGKLNSYLGVYWLIVVLEPWHPVFITMILFLTLVLGAVSAIVGWVIHGICLIAMNGLASWLVRSNPEES